MAADKTPTGVAGTELIELDELLPGDLEFVIGGEHYLCPGDIPVPQMLALMKAFQALQDIGTIEPGKDGAFDPDDVAQQQARTEAAMHGLHEQVVALFRLRDPDITVEDLPLGLQAMTQITMTVMQKMGATVGPVAGAVNGSGAPARPTGRGTTSGSRSSTRSRRPRPK